MAGVLAVYYGPPRASMLKSKIGFESKTHLASILEYFSRNQSNKDIE
jgi:hypothetical protein